MPKATDRSTRKRKLSIPRLCILLLIVMIPVGWGYGQARLAEAPSKVKPWFAPYVDVTATPTFAFQRMGTAEHVNAMLSFIVAMKTDACQPAWGAAYSLDQANAALSLDTRIARLRQRDGAVAISFGGRDNQELAVGCTDAGKLSDAYRQVIARYDVDTIDFDLEGDTLANKEANTRRAEVVAELQTKRRAAGKPLAVWLTLPVAPQGLTEAGTNAVTAFLDAKVDIAGVNVMTMDYGQSLNGQTMVAAGQQALTNTHRQLGVLYERANIHLSNATLWSKIGMTPMIGQNDFADEVTTLSDAQDLHDFAVRQGVGRMSMWSANRDVACGSNYPNVSIVSDSCSGVPQDPEQFMQTLGQNFKASLTDNANRSTTPEMNDESKTIVDDPASSPYQIWSKEATYIQGSKVVWKKNVYQAKWWTQGEVPDNPVLQSWETPWDLIGPVLPGDKPIAQPTLPAGTYPTWKGTATYNAGDRVLLDGVAYQAKWWTQGNSPAASAASPSNSPWQPLTQAQINDILNKNSS